MDITIHYEPAVSRNLVEIHAWEKDGKLFHFPGERNSDGTFIFRLKQVNLPDLRELRFKYYFPGTNELWESDNFIRQLPTTDAQEVWTFDHTPRCLTQSPQGSEVKEVIFHVITRNKYKGGQLYIWLPYGGDDKRVFLPETSRNDTDNTSTFVLPLQAWMQQGFHFKLMKSGGLWEQDSSNRVWRPSDGGEVWLKSDQLEVRSQPLRLVTHYVQLIHPKTFPAPSLNLIDTEGPIDTLQPRKSTNLEQDSQFQVLRYEVSVYLDAIYTVEFAGEGTQRQFRIRPEDEQGTSTAVFGNYQWTEEKRRNAAVRLVIHPNARSSFGSQISLQVGVGTAPAHETLVAERQPDGTWQTEFRAFPDVLQWLEPLSQDSTVESRLGIPLPSRRRLFTPSGEGLIQFHTIDGVSGMAQETPCFRDVAPEEARRLMVAAFSEEIVNANIFGSWEMPLGCIMYNQQVWFTLSAAHAAQTTLLILNPESPEGEPRQVREFPMNLTTDLRYWWCAIPAADAAHGTLYRFKLNNDQEVIDPASRWIAEGKDGKLWAQPGQGHEGPWSKVVDLERIRKCFDGSGWKTIGWDALIIYEMHAKRFTNRNPGSTSVFDQVVRELKPGQYLQRLGVTALEILPINEFPSDNSWGYNPSLFFAIESSYGGPEEFAKLVRASHDAGKGMMLDLVYNHLVESPLQAIAKDIYVDGETEWGDMVNYDNPETLEYFRQAFIYLWHSLKLDGFRFDCARAIIDGQFPLQFIIRHPGSGGGWSFLDTLHKAVRKAATVTGQPWPYLVGEIDPTNWGASDRFSGVLDGQWQFEHHYRIADAARNAEDKAAEIREQMNWPFIAMRPYYEAVRYGESHDSVSGQRSDQQRIVREEQFGFGRRMAKAVGTAALLAKGIPMLFMGEEAGEDQPFFFGQETYLNLNNYEDLGNGMNRVLAWFRDVMGLRNDSNKGLRGDDDQSVGYGQKTVAFTRGWGRIFVICTFGTLNTQQNVGWLGLPSSTPYKEIFNSSWPAYQVDNETEASNGSYNAWIYSGHIINLPYIGAVILERR